MHWLSVGPYSYCNLPYINNILLTYIRKGRVEDLNNHKSAFETLLSQHYNAPLLFKTNLSDEML